MTGDQVRYTHEEWLAKAEALFGKDAMAWRFVCPSCGHVASVADWKAAGASDGEVAFSCVGRRLPTCERAFQKGKGPCDYAGGGLFAINPVAVEMPSGGVRRTFAFAAVDSALEAEKGALAAERDALRAQLAAVESAMGKPKRERAPREPKAEQPEQTAEEQLGGAFLALATPRTVDELAKALGVSRAKATELAEDLVTDGRAAKVRAGRGWRFQRATAEEKGAAQ